MLQPKTETIAASEVRRNFASLVNRVFKERMRILVEKSGIPVAALISTDDLARLDRLDSERAQRFAILDEIRAAFKDVPTEEREREAEKALAEVRVAMRAEREQGVTASR